MSDLQLLARRGALTLSLCALGACTNAGSLGNILGGVLGGGNASQVSGTVQSVDTRAQQIYLQQQNGQTVGLGFDNQTQVVYQNQNYPVTALENGDQITARVQETTNGAYYTDMIQVDQSVRGNTGTAGTVGSNANVQSLQGTVRQIDVNNGWFTLDANNGVLLTVTLPYRPSNTDLATFQRLRPGDRVRFYGVFLNNSRVELRQFY